MSNLFSFRRLVGLCSVLAVASVPITTASARMVMPTDAPIARLLANVSDYVKRNPRDPNGYYTLGRIHYYAFAAPTRQTMPVIGYRPDRDSKNLLSSNSFPNPGRIPSNSREGKEKPLSASERTAHVKAAVQNLRQAITLKQNKAVEKEPLRPGVSELTLACVYEEGKADASESWREDAIRYYRLAYEHSVREESRNTTTTAPIFDIETLVSHEAANSYLRLVKERGARPDEKVKVAEVEKTVRRLSSLRRFQVVSPIIFALDAARPLSSLIAPHPQGMAFDLDGSARTGQRYSSWPRANTGILVWDPTHTGKITSGRQLFGNATWWIFWENGYRALQSLDDNRDGWLTAGELQSLGVWTDKNSNGRSDSGEVRPVMSVGITGLNVRGPRRSRDGWAIQNGVRLQSGAVLPTYDWVAETVGLKK